jgi:Protein of unknown function (DUF3106)
VRRHWWMKCIAFLVLAPAFVAAVSLVVMLLWNALVPSLFSGPVLGFWQAVGLLVLCRILFGGFRGRGGPPGWKHHRAWHDRWQRMTPEERERFRESFRNWKDMTREQRHEWREYRRGFRRRGFAGGFGGWCGEAGRGERRPNAEGRQDAGRQDAGTQDAGRQDAGGPANNVGGPQGPTHQET